MVKVYYDDSVEKNALEGKTIAVVLTRPPPGRGEQRASAGVRAGGADGGPRAAPGPGERGERGADPQGVPGVVPVAGAPGHGVYPGPAPQRHLGL